MAQGNANWPSGPYDSFDSMEGIAAIETTAPPRFFRSLPQSKLIHAIYPGLLVAGTIALASTWLAQQYTTPVMLFALLFGMAFHFLHEEGRCVAGIEFSSRTLLRAGVALLGVKITLTQIASLGVLPVAMVVVGVATTFLVGLVLARRLGLGSAFGVLSGGSVAICGASAALAIASVLPRHEQSERDTILTVVSITALSTLAMILYPVFATAVGLDHVRAGIFIGGTIHDVAQVVGAGYIISPETGDIATYVKLLRVAMLLPAVFVITLVVARTGERRTSSQPMLPGFLVAFALLVFVNSFGLLPHFLINLANDVSRWCLVTAIAALGMKTSFKALFAVGWRPIGLMLAETMWIAVLVFAAVKFVI
ncbi:MAG: putative sulfate exporter family transporter [Roseiarcus sp.]